MSRFAAVFLKKRRALNISQFIALVFLGIIALGTLLLCLPAASRDGAACPFETALFTATSATCVTGLVLADTWTQWSGFGQTVILCMIEIGGLGFMSIASFFIFALRKRVNMRQRLVIAQSVGAEYMSDAVRIQKRMLAVCLGTEGAGAALLTLCFLKKYGFLKALKLGVFHSVSAFCNAGFDIFGFEGACGSLTTLGTNAPVLLILAALIIIGGIGFLVWDELLTVRKSARWSVYTKLVLITTGALLIGGTLIFCLFEWRNPATLGAMTVPQKAVAAFFQSATTRTAGFAAVDQGLLTDSGKAATVFLMLIGGSSGSTAGGLKTVTFVVLLLFLWSRMRGKSAVNVFSRTIPRKHILDAMTLFGVVIILAFFGAVVICATSPVGFTDGLYEAVSALATVGLTTGVTASLSLPAKILIMLYMYFGRVGILTISLGFMRAGGTEDFTYAQTSVQIG